MTNPDKLLNERLDYALDMFVFKVLNTCKELGITATDEDIAKEFVDVATDNKLFTELYGKAKHSVCEQFTSNGAEEPVFPEDLVNNGENAPYSLIPCIGMLWETMPIDEYGNDCKDIRTLVCSTIENTLYVFLNCYAMVATRDFRGACV